MPRKTTRIDMHSHTRGSDGVGTPEQIVRHAVESGIHGLCLTDHHASFIDDNAEVWKVAQALREADIFPIVGCEYSTKQGHLLIFGPRIPAKHFGMYPDMQDVIDWANKFGGACVVPHPYQSYKYMCGDKLAQMEGLAGVEVLNGQVERRRAEDNVKARKKAEELGIPMTAGSDAHMPHDIGCVYTEFEGRIRGERKFLDALRAGDFRPVRNEKLIEKLAAERKKRYAAASTYKIPPAPSRGKQASFSFQNPEITSDEVDELDAILDQFSRPDYNLLDSHVDDDNYLQNWFDDDQDMVN